MCGIAGIYYFQQRPVDPDVLNRMSASLTHRGPDASGLYIDRGAGLAHRRLKIIDLSEKASQPMHDPQSRYHLVFNGEIYNFRQLRKELQHSFSFFSSSDTEVILRLFEQHREKTWNLLNGMFAIAIYDSLTRELFLARDHAGIKPLYIYSDTEKVLFASEPKAILASGIVSPTLESKSIGDYLRYGYFSGNQTPYRNMRKVLPGSALRIHPAGIEESRYWNIRLFSRQKQLPEIEAVDRIDSLLQKAVERQMISDVPLGAFLSGGVDSSLIVALMSRISRRPVKTFTVGFANMGYYDERKYAARIAAEFHTDHHEFVVEDKIETILLDTCRVLDEPFADSSAIPTYCLARMARSGVTVALSGTGGDELFGGYRKYLAARWARYYTGLPKSIRTSIEKATGLLPGSRLSAWKERALLAQRFVTLSPEKSLPHQLNHLLTDEEIQQLLGTPPPPPEFLPFYKEIAANMMLFDFEYYLPEDLLYKEDRCTMAFGLEARVPYLDRDVVEFISTLPLSFHVGTGKTKKLLKKVAARYLPGRVVRRPKHGFGSPIAEWLRQDLRWIAEEVFRKPATFELTTPLHQKITDHMAGRKDHSRPLWALLMLELWYRNH